MKREKGKKTTQVGFKQSSTQREKSAVCVCVCMGVSVCACVCVCLCCPATEVSGGKVTSSPVLQKDAHRMTYGADIVEVRAGELRQPQRCVLCRSERAAEKQRGKQRTKKRREV